MNNHNNLAFILFTENQFIDMVTCSAELNSVLSVDRTFNMETYFLTDTTFKNKKVIVINIGSNPVILGCCFYTKHQMKKTINFFFF